jgi:hypothetical protein
VTGKPQDAPTIPVFSDDGEAELRGRVTHDGEPVPDAAIQLERFVGVNSGSATVATRADGTFEAKKLLGGRYRLRAWLGDEYTLREAVTFFLVEDEKRDLPLELVDVPRGANFVVRVETDPSSPVVGREAEITFTVLREVIAPDGSVEEEVALADWDLELVGVDDWEIRGSRTRTTDDDGRVRFEGTCEERGAQEALVQIGLVSKRVDLPACREPGEPPDPIDVAVGDTVEVPLEGPLPAGVYLAASTDCRTTYVLWGESGDWADDRTVDTGRRMAFDVVARDFRAQGDSDPCTYERIE